MQEQREECMYVWIEDNKESLINDFIDLESDKFNEYCKECYFQENK